MESNEKKLLDAIHAVDVKVGKLETKIDDSVKDRFGEHHRRLSALESNQRWVVLAVLGSCITAIMTIILK